MIALIALLSDPGSAYAVDVWVDFTLDFHDGNNGAPSSVADWIDELNEATSRPGRVTQGPPSQNQFTAENRQVIEDNILTDLRQIYAGYDLNFVTQQSTGLHDVIYLGADNDASGVDGSLRTCFKIQTECALSTKTNWFALLLAAKSTKFGLKAGSHAILKHGLSRASGDLGNLHVRSYPNNPTGNPGANTRVFTGNFNSALEPRFNSQQHSIDEIPMSLAGTAAHEYVHSLGVFHQHAYSAIGISSEVTSTSGQQNQHIIARGSTGLEESQRESIRSLSPFSRVILGIAGGSSSEGSFAVVQNPVPLDNSDQRRRRRRFSRGSAATEFFGRESSGKEISF